MEEILNKLCKEFNLTLTKSSCSESIYLKIGRNKKIRISDHISTNNPGCYLNILISRNEYVIAFKSNIFVVKSLKRLYNYLYDFMIVFTGIESDYGSTIDYKLQQIETELKNSKNRIENQKIQLKEYNDSLINKNKVINELKKEVEDKKQGIDEAIELIRTLTEDPNSRDLLYSKDTGKTYYIDNFPETEQELIKECIKNYNK